MSVLSRWLKRRRLDTRLSEAEVLQIARTAAAGHPDRDLLTLVTRQERGGRPTWVVSAASVGSGLVVSIDDQSGQVVDMARYGVR